MNNTAIPINDKWLSIMADSGLFNAVLQDGSVVDLKTFVNQVEMDPNLSGLISKVGKFLKKVVHKPLKALPYIAMAASGGLLGPGASALMSQVGGSIAAGATKIGGSIGGLLESKSFGTITTIIRNALQQTGVIPTGDDLGASLQWLIQQQMSQEVGTQAVEPYGPAYYPAETSSSFDLGVIGDYMPLILIALIIYLAVRK